MQCLAAFGLTEQDFYVRLSDRDLWFYYLEALGLDEPRVRALLVAIDKHEKLGDGGLQELCRSVWAARSRGEGEGAGVSADQEPGRSSTATLEPFGAGTARARRLADWRRLLDGLAAMGLARFVEVDLGVVRGLAYYTGFVFEAFDRKGELRATGRRRALQRPGGQELGGPDLPAVGFAIGDVTMGLLLEQRGLMPAVGQRGRRLRRARRRGGARRPPSPTSRRCAPRVTGWNIR